MILTLCLTLAAQATGDIVSADPTKAGRDAPAPGFGLTELAFPGRPPCLPTAYFCTPSVTRTLANGDVLTWNGEHLSRYTADGTLITHYTTLSPAATDLHSFLIVDPTESFAVIGELATNSIYRVDFGTGTRTVLTNLFLNYDAVFETPDTILVCAAIAGNNEIFRVEVNTGMTLLVATSSGPSGPLALDDEGNLFYGVIVGGFPAPPFGSSVVLYSWDTLDGILLPDEHGAAFIGAGFDAISGLAYDETSGEVYSSENDFASGRNLIRRVQGNASESPVLVEGPLLVPQRTKSNLEFIEEGGPALFRPYQPTGGGRLRYQTVDFDTKFQRMELAPLRPTIAFEGPGTTGIGPFTLALENGPPSGFAWLFVCPSSAYDPVEIALPLSTAIHPLFVGLRSPVSSAGILTLDSSGDALANLSNPSGATGAVAAQALLFDADLAVVGVSAAGFY